MPELRLSHGSCPYVVHRRPRRTVGVVVRPDGSVEVHAPKRSSATEIRSVVEEFRPWIEKKRRAALERLRNRRARRFDDGDPVPYLGGTLHLRINETDAAPADAVVKDGGLLHVSVPPELTHIFEPNHSPAFWRRVGRACGHFEESRDWLRVHGDDLEL